MDNFKKNIFEMKLKHPYYIHCHPLKIHSAGIVVLHKLCHLLNVLGYPAYMVIDREFLGRLGYPKFGIHSSLITPELTTLLIDQHYSEGRSPIAIYSDSTLGDPFGTPVISRYFLNYPGLLTGEKNFSPNEIQYSYTQAIAKETISPNQTMFIPISDPNFFVPPQIEKRQGVCYYAAKYKHAHGQKVEAETEKHFEITRDREDSLTKEQLRDLFQKSELLICYENSAIAIEAALCGCPVAFVMNPYFTEVIAKEELGMDGFAWGLEEVEILRAKKTVHLFREKYLSSLDHLEGQLLTFISLTQEAAAQTPYTQKIRQNIAIASVGKEYPGFQIFVIRMMPIVRQLMTLSGLTWNQKIIRILKKSLRIIGLFSITKEIYLLLISIFKGLRRNHFSKMFMYKRISQLASNELPPHLM